MAHFKIVIKDAKNVNLKLTKINDDISSKLSVIKKDVEKNIEKKSKKMSQVIQHIAIYGGGNLDKILGSMKDMDKLKWAIAKFVSQKIKYDFNTYRIPNIKAKEYKKFLKEIISECDETVLWTCPYLPEKWFELAIENNSENSNINLPDEHHEDYGIIKYFSESKIEKRKNLMIYTSDDFDFLEIFKYSTAKNKYRIVNLSSNQFEKLNIDNCSEEELYYLFNFIRLNIFSGIKLYFIDVGEATKISTYYSAIGGEDFCLLQESKNFVKLTWANKNTDSDKKTDDRNELNLQINQQANMFKELLELIPDLKNTYPYCISPNHLLVEIRKRIASLSAKS